MKSVLTQLLLIQRMFLVFQLLIMGMAMWIQVGEEIRVIRLSIAFRITGMAEPVIMLDLEKDKLVRLGVNT